MTSISLKMVKVVILSVAQLVTTVIFFSARDKSRVKWDNSRNSTQKMRTIIGSGYGAWSFFDPKNYNNSQKVS